MRFHNPVFLFLLLLIPFFIYVSKRRKRPVLEFSSKAFVKDLPVSFKAILKRNIVYLRALALVFIIIALARPQSLLEPAVIKRKGIDIVLAVDVSTSMLAEDFEINGQRRNRLDVVKTVIKEFIRKRENDRIGIIMFAGMPYTICPLTLDHDWLLRNFERIKIGKIEDGTAVGSAIASAVNRLKNSKAKSKIMILLTDGVNNAGEISPLMAAETAKAFGIKIYTIGAGTKGEVPYPAKDMFGRKVYTKVKIEIDEKALKKIASITGGSYFRATDTESLERIYGHINKMEKISRKQKTFTEYRELFKIFTYIALIILFLEIAVSNVFLRQVP